MAIAASGLLVFVLVVGQRGVHTSVASHAPQAGVDLWAAPIGSDNTTRAPTILLSGSPQAFKTISGVRTACPLLRGAGSVESRAEGMEKGNRLNMLPIGYHEASGLGGRPHSERDELRASGEVGRPAVQGLLWTRFSSDVWVVSRPAWQVTLEQTMSRPPFVDLTIV